MWWHKYLYVPFAEKGRTLEGCDCWGLVRLIYKNERGIELPSYDDLYADTNQKALIAGVIGENLETGWFEVETPQEFDIVILDMIGFPMHVGLVTKKDHMLHCLKGMGTVHENLTGARWKHKVRGYYRCKA